MGGEPPSEKMPLATPLSQPTTITKTLEPQRPAIGVGKTVDELLQKAAEALHAAKQGGENTVALYHGSSTTAVADDGRYELRAEPGPNAQSALTGTPPRHRPARDPPTLADKQCGRMRDRPVTKTRARGVWQPRRHEGRGVA